MYRRGRGGREECECKMVLSTENPFSYFSSEDFKRLAFRWYLKKALKLTYTLVPVDGERKVYIAIVVRIGTSVRVD